MPPKLIFFLPDAKGGVDTFTNNYIQKLTGIDIKVIKYKTIKSLFNNVTIVNINNVAHVSVKFSKYATPRSKFGFLRKLIDENCVLVCNDSFEMEMINGLGLKNKIVYILHGDLNHYRNILNNYQPLIDLVLCVSNGLKEKYKLFYPDLKFEVSHPLLVSVPEMEFSVRKRLNCIYVGKFEYQKGADLFLDLVKSYKQEINWTIAAISDGSEANLLAQIPSHVKVYMDLTNERVLAILDQADVLIFPSRSEGFGIAVLEAMSRGVVPIVLNIPIGIPDQVMDGYNGFIVNIENWNEVSGCLEKLSSDGNLLLRMKKNAVRFVKVNFNSNTIADDFVNQIMCVLVNEDKRFYKHSYPYLTYLPEPLYRALKFGHNIIKYG